MVRITDPGRLAELRRSLHEGPELSGRESGTASLLRRELTALTPSKFLENLGGNGLAAEFSGGRDGPRVLLRCDMDALPIGETLDIPYRSSRPGVSHKCGHDGHMAIMVGVGQRFSAAPPGRGSVILLFQPSEETGEGARRVLGDDAFRRLKPDMAFALHNLPGFPEGSVILREGVFASASRGMTIRLMGSSSHASEPHLGRSPAMAAAAIVQGLSGLPQASVPMSEGSKVTVIHVRVGEEAFGTSPGDGCVMATLRTHHPGTMEAISERAAGLAGSIASAWGIECSTGWTEEFPATVNSPKAVGILREAASGLGLTVIEPDHPFPWSEDFGHYADICAGALFGLGAGTDTPALHSPEYDFPDGIIATGADMLEAAVRCLCG